MVLAHFLVNHDHTSGHDVVDGRHGAWDMIYPAKSNACHFSSRARQERIDNPRHQHFTMTTPSTTLVIVAIATFFASACAQTCTAGTTTYTRSTTSPADCVDTSSCSYICSGSYGVAILESCSLTISPLYSGSDCDCNTGTGTLVPSSDTATATFPDGSIVVFSGLGTSDITAVAQVSGLTCTATYTEGTGSASAELSANVLITLAAVAASVGAMF
eukprot:m.11209 g.11209  ORF g.11209 m.11209 type:complete len:216 (-) comp8295_c0_seq1:254-901(-)